MVKYKENEWLDGEETFHTLPLDILSSSKIFMNSKFQVPKRDYFKTC